MKTRKRENPKNNYLLIGIPCVGKRTIGKMAADGLKMEFVDTDLIVREKYFADNPGPPSFSFFRNGFLEKQRDVLEDLSLSAVNTIIAAGAEAVPHYYNHEAIRKTGTVILIKRDRNAVIAEAKRQPIQFVEVTNRANPINLTEKIFEEYLEIADYDMLADVTINNDGTIEECAEKLIRFIENAIEKTPIIRTLQ
jgi:shikimate kinase